MKNLYVKPEIEVIEVDNNAYMLTVSAGDDLPGIGNGGDTGETPDGGIDANRHRGEWGNLWAN